MINLVFKPFQKFIFQHTSERSRARYSDSKVISFQLNNEMVYAIVQGTKRYQVSVKFNQLEVVAANCTCPFADGGACKHIINTLVYADNQLKVKSLMSDYTEDELENTNLSRIDNKFIIENSLVTELESREIELMSITVDRSFQNSNYNYVSNSAISPNQFSGILNTAYGDKPKFLIIQKNKSIYLECTCANQTNYLCEHLNYMLKEIARINAYKFAFDDKLRHDILLNQAHKLGLKNPQDLDNIFQASIEHGRLHLEPKFNILNLNSNALKSLKEDLVPDFKFPTAPKTTETVEFLLLVENEYSGQMEIEWMQAPLSKLGAIKSPITQVNVNKKMTMVAEQEHLTFYVSILQQKIFEDKTTMSDQILALKQLFKNPFNLPYYYHNQNKYHSQKITLKSMKPLVLNMATTSASIFVKQQNDYYVLSCKVTIDNIELESKRIKLIGSFFLWMNKTLHFIDNLSIIRIINFFSENKHELFIHTSQYADFQSEFLHKLELSITVNYEYVKPAPARIIKTQSLDKITEYMIYLSESDDYILITPVVSYGESEVSVLSKRSIYVENPAGGMYSIQRNEASERRFIRTIVEQHTDFANQTETEFYYLHKQEFLETGWFLDAFEHWRNHNFSILGFNQLKNNRLNTNKMNVKTVVKSGIDWFEIHANVKFGDQEVGLKEIQKAVLNKNRYVKLGDGSMGIMPTEWIEQFGQYFRSGEINGDFIKTHHTNFKMIDDLFEQEVLSQDASLKLEIYREKLNNFHSIRATEIPKKLKATLRDYQKEGLNWLNFLDEFGFGGCLADDMGLGKTIQIIAYFLQQKEKGNNAPNLVILPTSLLFNWQAELDKFAPNLTRCVVYGAERKTKEIDFSKYDIVLTSYGTMLSDIEHLKSFYFNCIVLDESQAIKNPDSKRYKAVRLLQGRQRIVMTGTPIENNTFDLYAQLSFAIPGLFGGAKRFADEYSTPIDKYQETKRAAELQQKIHPFVLRRTKLQVAKELPEKTEMILHCNMGTHQRRVYETYKKEFQLFLSKQEPESLSKNSLHVLQGLTKLRQICNSPALLSDEEYYGHESAKMEVLLEQINLLKDQHKILVFSQFVGMLNLVKAELDKQNIQYAYLTGKTKDRQFEVEKFQEDEKVRIFLISLKAGGTGLNLTKAEYVFLIDPWWNPAVENQAIDRAYRIGQENKVIAIRLITPNTIEEKIIELQSRKKQLVQDLVHTDVNVLKQLKKEDLLNLL